MALGPTTAPAWSAEVEAAMAEEQADPRQLSAFDHMPLPAVIDLLLATTTLTTTGDAKRGWRVASDTAGTQLAWFVVKRGGRALLLGGPGMLAGIGAEVFAALGRGDLAGARAWLTRVADDPTLPTGHPVADFLRRHRDVLDAADRPMVELMASLFMSDRFPASAVPAVRTCGGFTATDDLKLCALARATRAATAGAHDEMVAAARVFVAALPDDALATALLGRALALAGKAAEGPAARCRAGQAPGR
ncbi:MAG: hypothetical protein IPH80_11310 [Myxococcales bacterium]|nr:hypothetical protein [Myxococcales bacterium]